ncbi:DNA mismatch repair protein [Balamuthia mandrillaris]
MSEGDLKYAAPVSRNLVCPICHDVFVSPVITAECGHSFCRKCIYQALPRTIAICLVKKQKAVEQIGSEEEEPQQHTGECPLCRATVHKSRVHANHALAGLLSELDKQAHEAVCEFAAAECPYWTLGCAWNGTKQSLKHHLQHDCPFDKMQDFVKQTTSEIAELKKTIEAREIRYLKRALGKSSRMELELNEEEEDKKQKEEDEREEEEDEEAPHTDKNRKGNARQKSNPSKTQLHHRRNLHKAPRYRHSFHVGMWMICVASTR